jgi:hypothetical protein
MSRLPVIGASLTLVALCRPAQAQTTEPRTERIESGELAPARDDHFAIEVSPFTIYPFLRLGGTFEWLPVAHHAFFLYFARALGPKRGGDEERGFVAAQGYRLYSKSGGPQGWFGTLLVEEGEVAFTPNPPGPREHARSIGAAIEAGYKWSLEGWLVAIGGGVTFQYSTWTKGGGEDIADPTLLRGVLPRVVFDIGRAF